MYKKDKLGWVKFNPTHYKNEKFPNIIIYRINVPGVLYPWGIQSGQWKGNSFYLDNKLNLGGFAVDGKKGCHKIAENWLPGLDSNQ